MAALTAELAVCENLVPYYQNLLDSKKQDALWLHNASSKLMASNCVDDQLFFVISEMSHQLNPTSASAYNIGIAAFRKGDQQKAAEYFDQSAELNADPDQKAATSIYSSNNKAKAKEYALKAVFAQPKYGRAYLFLAQLYGESGADCATSAFEKKALNWLAAETALKAAAADPQFKTGAAKMAENYNKKAPTADEIRDEKKNGKTVSFRCWINETISVPNL
jgi:tetratricopeptide (TPR) repeat protein